MDHSESCLLPFIVRIWVDEAPESGGNRSWRGKITHVPSGQSAPITDLDDASRFMLTYLQALGVKPTFFWRTREFIRKPLSVR